LAPKEQDQKDGLTSTSDFVHDYTVENIANEHHLVVMIQHNNTANNLEIESSTSPCHPITITIDHHPYRHRVTSVK
jgi:nanoRNase/pAp phosphatase (c-di-AMP/oligoRNAs hydrolase)